MSYFNWFRFRVVHSLFTEQIHTFKCRYSPPRLPSVFLLTIFNTYRTNATQPFCLLSYSPFFIGLRFNTSLIRATYSLLPCFPCLISYVLQVIRAQHDSLPWLATRCSLLSFTSVSHKPQFKWLEIRRVYSTVLPQKVPKGSLISI